MFTEYRDVQQYGSSKPLTKVIEVSVFTKIVILSHFSRVDLEIFDVGSKRSSFPQKKPPSILPLPPPTRSANTRLKVVVLLRELLGDPHPNVNYAYTSPTDTGFIYSTGTRERGKSCWCRTRPTPRPSSFWSFVRQKVKSFQPFSFSFVSTSTTTNNYYIPPLVAISWY